MTTKLLWYKGRASDNPRSRIFDNLICLIDGGKYSHVEFIEGETITHYQTFGSHAGRGGVSYGLYPRSQLGIEYDIMTLADEPVYDTHVLLGSGYDYLGLLNTKLSWWPQRPNKYFCSELIAEAYGLEDPSTWGVERLYVALKPRAEG